MKIQIIERVRITTPLGLRFRDIVTDQLVRSGLRVTARLEDDPLRVVTAQPTAGGIYAFHHLPELRDIEYANEDLRLDQLGAVTRRYIVRVEDPQGIFMPVAFIVSAPQAGIFPNGEGNGSPPGLSAFDLFSQPARLAPGGFAEVCADLIDAAAGLPAAHALLEVRVNGNNYFGLSDSEGKVVVMLPYPPVEIAGEGSPALFDTLSPLSEQQWTVYIRVRYQPGSLQQLPGTEEPNLRTVLEQGEGHIYREPGTPVGELTETLTFAQPLVLRTEGMSNLEIGT